MKRLNRIINNNEAVLALFAVLLFIGFSFSSPYFFKLSNLMQVSAQLVELGLLTLAMSASILSGGMDLSIGAMASLFTVLLAIFMGVMEIPMWTAILMTLGIAILCGALNGFLCGYLKINSMLATLGTQALFTGIGLVISKGVTIQCINEKFFFFGQGRIGGLLPFQTIILIVVALLSYVLFSLTRWGRRVYLIGSSTEVAKFAGINLERNIMLVYIYSAIMSFASAIIIASRISGGRADVAVPLVLQSVSAAVFGGISIKGGTGNVLGAMIGVVIFTLVSNGMNMIGASQFLQQIIIGSILLIVLMFRQIISKRHN
ncbi:MAG: ABC transporter permease [Clostridiales bacterium]|nr:ABC transporter permease [Clostridiales bacterium]